MRKVEEHARPGARQPGGIRPRFKESGYVRLAWFGVGGGAQPNRGPCLDSGPDRVGALDQDLETVGAGGLRVVGCTHRRRPSSGNASPARKAARTTGYFNLQLARYPAARGQGCPGFRAALHPRSPLRRARSHCKDNITILSCVVYLLPHRGFALRSSPTSGLAAGIIGANPAVVQQPVDKTFPTRTARAPLPDMMAGSTDKDIPGLPHIVLPCGNARAGRQVFQLRKWPGSGHGRPGTGTRGR